MQPHVVREYTTATTAVLGQHAHARGCSVSTPTATASMSTASTASTVGGSLFVSAAESVVGQEDGEERLSEQPRELLMPGPGWGPD
jgi:hypothetical protein